MSISLLANQIFDEYISSEHLKQHTGYADAEILYGKIEIALHAPFSQCADYLIEQDRAQQKRHGNLVVLICRSPFACHLIRQGSSLKEPGIFRQKVTNRICRVRRMCGLRRLQQPASADRFATAGLSRPSPNLLFQAFHVCIYPVQFLGDVDTLRTMRTALVATDTTACLT